MYIEGKSASFLVFDRQVRGRKRNKKLKGNREEKNLDASALVVGESDGQLENNMWQDGRRCRRY
jgi:hypothetical protein